MLGHLELSNVGPAPKLEIDFAERLNLITRDNGLGKSFLLDVAWWALTQTWAREMARPARGCTRLGSRFGSRLSPHQTKPHFVGMRPSRVGKSLMPVDPTDRA